MAMQMISLIVPTLWFGDNNCEEAIKYYACVFSNSEILNIVKYPDDSSDERFKGMSGKVIRAEFTLNGQMFYAFDGGSHFHFNEAISMAVLCENQAEIDYYWEKLSNVKEAERCGWAKDRFGLSWQVIPHNLNDLMKTDAQIQAMLKMKKIIIKVLEEAGL